MVFHRSLDFDIADQWRRELIARREPQRLSTASLAGRNDDRSRSSTSLPVGTTSGRRSRLLLAKRPIR
jgi:hypothetical protein